MTRAKRQRPTCGTACTTVSRSCCPLRKRRGAFDDLTCAPRLHQATPYPTARNQTMPVPIPSYLNVEITRAGATTVVEFLIIPDEIWHAGDFKAGVRNLDPKDRDLQYI